MASSDVPDGLLGHPLFADLTSEAVLGIAPHLHVERHARGTRLFHRGDPGTSLYVVISGQISLEHSENGQHRVVAVCGPGDWFGEVALLTAGPRTADACVAVDATLIRIDRHGWTELSLRVPRVFALLCQRLSRQLRATTESEPRTCRKVVTCHEPHRGPSWLPQLVRSLRRQFPRREIHALRANGTPLQDAAPPGTSTQPDRKRVEDALAQIVAHESLILLATASMDDLGDIQLRRADDGRWMLTPGRSGRACDHVTGATEVDAIDRVARHLAHGTVGLALGAGGAFGLAHIGLIHILEAANVPVDFVAGASIGAIVGAAIAAGVPVGRMTEFANDVGARYRRIVLHDLDLRGPSLLTGNGVSNLLGELAEVRDATFESLFVPFAAIAMDLHTGREVVLRSGPLLEGIRPSYAMPGIFPPCTHPDGLLVDGAMVNPVPVDLARVLGADMVIAAQPIPGLQREAQDPVGSAVGRARRLADYLPFSGFRGGLDALDVSLRSFQSLWFQLASSSALAADLVATPDLSEFWFLQFADAGRIIDAGRRYAEEMLPSIRSVLRERVGLELPSS